MDADSFKAELGRLAEQRAALEKLCRALDLDPLTARVPELAKTPDADAASRQLPTNEGVV